MGKECENRRGLDVCTSSRSAREGSGEDEGMGSDKCHFSHGLQSDASRRVWPDLSCKE